MTETLQINPSGNVPAASNNDRGQFRPHAGVISFALGSVLAVGTAIECQSVAPLPNSFASWALSLSYGVVLWLWWSAVVVLLWRAEQRSSFVLSLSLKSLGVHLWVGVTVVLIHLSVLQVVVNAIARFGPADERPTYADLGIFT